MKRALLLTGSLFVLTSPANAAQDMLKQCLSDYPHKVDWCNQQYAPKPETSAPPAAPKSEAPQSPEPSVAERDDSLDTSSKVRSFTLNSLAYPNVARRLQIGEQITTIGGMGCFRFSETEYRCVKQIGERGVIFSAPEISGVSREHMDQHCFTFVRGFKDLRCGFSVTFTLTGRGLDHMEKVQIYLSDRLELRPWSKY